MARIKYYYDTETCKYERVKSSIWEVLLNFIGLFVVTLLISAGLIFLYIKIVPNKKVIALKKENKILIEHKKNIETKLGSTKEYISYLLEKDKSIYEAITGTKFKEDKNTITQPIVYLEKLRNGMKISDLIKDKNHQIDSLINQSKVSNKDYIATIKDLKKNFNRLKHIPAIQPISNVKLKRLASGFGYRTHPVYKLKVKHEGVDFSAPEGTPVYSTADGIVEKAKNNFRESGVYLKINHGFHYKTTYSHLQKFVVKEGQAIKRGQLIGYVGLTGQALSSHLGYEIIYKGKKVDPIDYFFIDISAEDWFKLLKLARLDNQTLS